MLRIENLSKVFNMRVGGEKTIPCLGGVTLEVEPGRMLAVIGPSGAGKSSLLKCVYGTYLATGGNIYYTDGAGVTHDLASADLQTMRRLRAEEIGYVSQFFRAIPRVSALDILSEPLVSRGTAKPEARQRARELLRAADIPESLWQCYPSTFSGGEKQRLNIIRGLITRPRLLLLDEPTASLDPQSKLKVLELIRDLKRRGSIILGVFHDYGAMRSVADRSYHIVTREMEDIA
ncbi:MAG: ATP-binding cassette domain-containing protein [Oscillospiraceae bacterium]|jgi:alpha-D-ribose 1-methylphosphonate 5-triphosphate synthase subunit PhnL|nr:ATP-binding cassette domain-containing protein [Oscillospiraceae bacterium]